MKTAMAYYGPHGERSQVDGPVGMGHLLLELNPEDAFEDQPVRGRRGLVVTEARLDNRADLLNTFHIPAAETSRLSDGHLVSLAFDRWGEEVCSHLQGDWALAAWDARERRLLLALNACGNSPLYYHEGKGFIAFASSLKALLALPGVSREPNLLRLAHVLVSWWPDGEITAYQDIRRVAWAHAMSVAPNGQTRTWRYWSPQGLGQLTYRRDEDYEEAFLELYKRSIQSCLRTQKPVAAQLSGGRDSGSVVTLAAPLLASQGRGLTGYTSVPWLPTDGVAKHRLGNEWELAHATATLAGPNVEHLPLDARDYGVIQGIQYLIDVHDGPSHATINNFWVQAIMEAGEHMGAGVMLNGSMGNATVSWIGNGSALRALLQGYPSTAFRLLLHAEPNPWLTLKRQLLKPLLTPGRRMIRRLKAPQDTPWQTYSAIHPHMALELDLKGRMKAAGYDETGTFSPLDDLRLLYFDPSIGIGTGLGAECGARHRLAYLDPTANLPLVEFITRVPDEQFRRGDGSSWLYRRSFRNLLPEAVLNSRLKGLQAADAGHRIIRELATFRECLDSLDSLPEAREVLDMRLMHRCLDDLVAKVDPETTERAGTILLRGIGVGLFLRGLAGTHP
jgi:asparagine synthase (glutamine-hydrolysing)